MPENGELDVFLVVSFALFLFVDAFTVKLKVVWVCNMCLSDLLEFTAFYTIWAPSSEFVSSSILSWQILTVHAQSFRGARDLAFCLKVSLESLLVWASSGGSGETARMRRLAWTFAARICYKYQIRLTQSIWSFLSIYASLNC